MAQRAHRSFGQVYADQETINESEKRTPLISPENARKLSEKKRKYVKRRKKLQTEENDQLWKKWRNIATSIRRKAIKQYWTERSDELRTNPDAPSSKHSRHFWEIKVVVKQQFT